MRKALSQYFSLIPQEKKLKVVTFQLFLKIKTTVGIFTIIYLKNTR